MIEAIELLNLVTGEAREELIELRTVRVQDLEAQALRAGRMKDVGRASKEQIGEISQALAREGVALFELMR